jgi:hypothetical protein
MKNYFSFFFFHAIAAEFAPDIASDSIPDKKYHENS